MSAYHQHLVDCALEARATAHRPADPTRLRTEAQRMADNGLLTADIAEILGLHVTIVAQLLARSAE
jgi:hypothetical protein